MRQLCVEKLVGPTPPPPAADECCHLTHVAPLLQALQARVDARLNDIAAQINRTYGTAQQHTVAIQASLPPYADDNRPRRSREEGAGAATHGNGARQGRAGATGGPGEGGGAAAHCSGQAKAEQTRLAALQEPIARQRTGSAQGPQHEDITAPGSCGSTVRGTVGDGQDDQGTVPLRRSSCQRYEAARR